MILDGAAFSGAKLTAAATIHTMNRTMTIVFFIPPPLKLVLYQTKQHLSNIDEKMGTVLFS